MSYSRKKGESCPSHTKKCVTIEFEPQNREKGVCTAQNRGESLQFLPISSKIDSPGIIFTKSYPRHNNTHFHIWKIYFYNYIEFFMIIAFFKAEKSIFLLSCESTQSIFCFDLPNFVHAGILYAVDTPVSYTHLTLPTTPYV